MSQQPIAVVGAGVAGLYCALQLAERGQPVVLFSRKKLNQVSSFWAQGGLAAVCAADDNLDLHAQDTLTAGRGLCYEPAVEVLVREAPQELEDLQRRGMRFDCDAGGELALSLEGGHSRRRVVHAGGSRTGAHLLQFLAQQVVVHPNITLREGDSVLALCSADGECCGVVTNRGPLACRAVVLATGGYAALWRRSSNPWGSIGAGLVLAEAAGAELADLEFCQFHPTALHLPGHEQDGFLITEAIRGEGAKLYDAKGERFVNELAPRDEVARAIFAQLEDGQVYLDMRGVPHERFPNVVEALGQAGLDPRRELIPVAPAAHYCMGGIRTDLYGRTSLRRLFAVGECSCSGLHGANRLASNSLSECFVFARRASEAAVELSEMTEPAADPRWRLPKPGVETRERVWELAGPRRSREQLARLLDDPYPLAQAIGWCALAREESRGPHQRSEFPHATPGLDGHHTIYCGGEAQLTEWREPSWQ